MITFLCFGDHCHFLFYLNPVPYIILIRCSAEMVLAVWARCTSFAGLWRICHRLMTHLPSAYGSSAIGLWRICHRLMAHLPLSWCVLLHQTVCQKESVAVRYQCKVTPIYLKTCRNRHYFGIFFEKREKNFGKMLVVQKKCVPLQLQTGNDC